MRAKLAGAACCALLLLCLPGTARAQATSGTDVLTGVVQGEDGAPFQGATIEAYSLETQVTRRATSDARGRFTILFTDGGGQYRMTARAIGMSPRIAILTRQADEDRLIWNVRLASSPVTLEAINVRSGPQVTRMPDQGPTPGSTERGFGIEQISRLPVDAGDLALLTSLVPGVLTLGATDTTATAFSVAGLGSEANAQTLDGILFGNSSIPQDGLRQTRVITSTYDVSRGQFSGGLVSSTTRAGSNMLQGSSQYQLRDQDLAVAEDDSPYAQGFTQHLISGGLGGPIVKDRLFWFGSAQARIRLDPQQTLLSANTADYARLGVNPDSVTRFLSIVNGLGVPTSSVPGGANRQNNNLSALVRVDYVVSNNHTLTLRGDWRGTSQDPTRLGALALPQTGGELSSGGAGIMATMTSHFGATMINALQTYYSTSNNDGSPFTPVPAGRVQVASDLPDGSVGVTTLAFGGNAGLPTVTSSRSISTSDELSWIPGSGAHRLKLGGNLDFETSHNTSGNNQLGTFTYLSLADLENDLPSLFRRTVVVADRQALNRRWGLYAGDVWYVKRPFQLTYGVRLEGSSFGNAPALNPAIETAFGRRTSYLPTETHFSPRIGFTWTIGAGGGGAGGGGGGFGGPGGGGRGPGAGGQMPSQQQMIQMFTPPKLVVRGGIGEFRSQPPTGLVAQAQGATGLSTSSAEIFCSGSGIPTPDWDQYWIDQSAIPTSCASAGPPPPLLNAPRPVVVFAPGFNASRAIRGSLSLERRLTQLFRVTVEGSFSRGMAQAGYRDLNLRTTPQFTLASEANRPVYVTVADITPVNGVSRYTASRVDSAFGQVLEANSTLRTRSEQVTASLGGIFGPAIQMNLSYTWQHARDQASGARGGNTAGNPNLAEWGASNFGRTHSMLLTLTYPVSRAIEITTIGRINSGAPFTPIVSGDVNADGLRNDRAFIYAPGTATTLEQGMQRLLASSSGGIRECLQSQLGTIAGRNSCRGPWQGSLDFQLNWRPTMLGLNRRLTLSVVTQNFLRGLDEILHGSDNAKGWGLQTQPDNNLLYVTGFDSVANRYNYTVNERFGATYGSATAYRPPFQVGINMRISIGPDRARQALDAMRAGGGGGGAARGGDAGGFRPGGVNAGDMVARIEAATPNAAGVALEMRDSLHLDSGQVALLIPVRDSFTLRNNPRLDSLRAAVGTGSTSNPNDMIRLLPVLRPLFAEARTEAARDIVTVRAILTEEQWAKMPQNIREFQQNPFGPGLGQPGQARPGQGRPEGRGRP